MWSEIWTGIKVATNPLWISMKIGETQEASAWSWKGINWVTSGFCVSVICHKDKLLSCHFVLRELQVPREASQRWEIIRTNDTAGFWSCCATSLPAPLAVLKGNSDVEPVIRFSFFRLPGLLCVLQRLLFFAACHKLTCCLLSDSTWWQVLPGSGSPGYNLCVLR